MGWPSSALDACGARTFPDTYHCLVQESEEGEQDSDAADGPHHRRQLSGTRHVSNLSSQRLHTTWTPSPPPLNTCGLSVVVGEVGPTLDSLVEWRQGDAAGGGTQQAAHLRWQHHAHL